ncbi:MAG: hypothetical protein ACXW18_12640 [Pyrinomonadaceae bacterium]
MKKPKIVLLIFLVLAALSSVGFAQKADKPWTEWSKEEVQKLLENSPWAQIQNDTDTSQQFFSPTSDPGLNGARANSNTESRQAQGATNQAVNVKYFVRLFSARPIRQALIRQMVLKQKPPDEAFAKMRQFAEVKSETSIIVTVSFESTDQRAGNKVMQAFNSAVTSTLKNNTYLQRTDGKQLFLEEYIPPGKDGFGARFIFLRLPDERPFVDAKTTELRFVAQFSSDIKIDRRFKLADMKYQGELEF